MKIIHNEDYFKKRKKPEYTNNCRTEEVVRPLPQRGSPGSESLRRGRVLSSPTSHTLTHSNAVSLEKKQIAEFFSICFGTQVQGNVLTYIYTYFFLMWTIFLNILQYCFCFGLFVDFFFLATRCEVIAL